MSFSYHEFLTHIQQVLLLQGEGKFLLMPFIVYALGEFGIPFPFVSQGFLLLSGYEVAQGNFHIVPLIFVLLVSRQVGAAIIYFGGRLFGNPFIEWFGKHMRQIKKDVLVKIQQKLGEKAIGVVVLGRLTPGLLVPTSLVAGTLKIPYGYFALGVVFSGAIWDSIFVTIGILGRYGFR